MDELDRDVSLRTIRRIMRELGLSFSKKRPIHHKSAIPEEQERFKADAQRMTDAATGDGFTVVYEYQIACQPGGTTHRSWHLPEDCEGTASGFSKVLARVFGELGRTVCA